MFIATATIDSIIPRDKSKGSPSVGSGEVPLERDIEARA
jgi:hypothetical protein